MPDGSVIVTDADMDRLTRLGRAFKHSLFRDQQQLYLLDQTLAAAEVRPSVRIPRDVLGMNSRVRVFDFDTRRRELYTLTFPAEANIAKGMISGLAPLGIALLGRRKGDVIEARVPGGIRKLKVEGVRQQPAVSRTKPSEDSSTKRTSHLRRAYEAALAT
jgi:regulator of nucleoside diphosphate kinase